MKAEQFYNQEMNEKPSGESCFADTEGITYRYGEIENEQIHSSDEMIAFAEAHHKVKLEDLKWRIKQFRKGFNKSIRIAKGYCNEVVLENFTDDLKEIDNIVTDVQNKSKKEVLICENCKTFWIAPMDRCSCGSTSLAKTHISNYALAKNLMDDSYFTIITETK